MSSTRRTRAMGHSPGGPKALDLNAPTRQTRKAKLPEASGDVPAPATAATRVRSASKRGNEDLAAEDRPVKKLRLTKATGRAGKLAAGSTAMITLPDSESEIVPESSSSSQGREHALEPEQVVGPRVSAQQPTPPLDTPVDDESSVRSTAKTPPTNMAEAPTTMAEDELLTSSQPQIYRKKQVEKRISDMIRRYHAIRHGEEEDEKPLSECDDDEWEQRYSTVMEKARHPTPFISNSKEEWEKGAPGGSSMIIVRALKEKDTTAKITSGPCMPSSSLSLGLFTSTSCLAALGACSLTNNATVVAVSASLDWYEKNPSIEAPSATEMNAMLDNFARAKQAEQSETANPYNTQTQQNPTRDGPLTPRAPQKGEDSVIAPHSSDSGDDHSSTDDLEEQGFEQTGDYSANLEQGRVESLGPSTPVQQLGPQGPRTWASALSASVIGNVILTPLNNWFTRRDRERRNIANTEPRPPRPERNVTRSAKSHQKPSNRNASVQSNKTLLVKNNSMHDPAVTLLTGSPTPASLQPRRGRPDSHLPVHLRGVLFEDLPLEWQAVSEHMKKPQQAKVSEEEDDDEPVDMEYLLATAKRTRKERNRKELQEQAELIAQKQRDLESDNEVLADQADRKRRKRVTFSPQKTYSAKLGHSTFGVPLNIDDSSSEEEPEDFGPRTHFGRNSRPMKSCLKRSCQQPAFGEYNDEGDMEDGHELRPAKKARLDEYTSQDLEVLEVDDDTPWREEGRESFLYDDDPHRARPLSHFVSKPPSELRKAEAAQLEYEKLNPRSRGQGLDSAPSRISHYQNDRPNLHIGETVTPNQAWLNIFTDAVKNQRPRRRQSPIKRPSSSALGQGSNLLNTPRTPQPSQPDENGQQDGTSAPLGEASEARLNKQREDAMKHKPKTSSGLQVAHTLSPIQEISASRNLILDEEVLRAIALLDDDEIIAEKFGKYPECIEDIVSIEASKAFERALLEEVAKAVEVAEGEGEK